MDGALPREVETPGGLSLKFNGSWLYSSRDPRALPERSALSFEPPDRSVIVVFSPLLGYGLETLLSRLPPDSFVLCLEAEESLYRLSLGKIPEPIRSNPRFSLAFAQDGSDLSGRIPDLSRYRRAVPLALSGGYRLHDRVYDGLLARIEREIGIAWRNRATLNKLGRLWIRNLISNLSNLPGSRSLDDLDEAVGNRAVLVAGAGPSLERLYKWLPGKRESVFLLAVDTALPALRASGIEPDAVVCLEGQAYNLKDFIGSRGSGIPLIVDLSAHPASFNCLGGSVYPLSSRFADCALLDRLESSGLLPYALPPLGSVGVAALGLALRRWGARNVILVSGLDFAYRRGSIHARGTPSHAAYLRARTRISPDTLYAASLRPGTRALPQGPGAPMITDPVLSGYAELARTELASIPATALDMRYFGLDLGIRNLPEDFIFQECPSSAPSPIRGGRAPATADRLLEFVDEETERARRLRETLAGARDPESLAALIGECDYLSLHFPDRPSRPELDQSFLNRLSVEADSAIARWRAAGERIRALGSPGLTGR